MTIWLVPVLEAAVTWRWAFLLLVPGPLLGHVAMGRLQRLQGQSVALTARVVNGR